jgi:hypothetical protein
LFEHGLFSDHLLFYTKTSFILISVIKVDRPLRSGYSQPGSPYGNPCNGLPSFSNGAMGGGNPYRTHSIAGSAGRPVAYHNAVDNNPSYSSASSYEFPPQAQMTSAVPQTAMMMMPPAQQNMAVMHQQSVQPMGVMQQHPAQSMSVMQQQPMQPIGVMQQQPVQSMSLMQQQPVQSMGVMQQQPVQQQYMYQPVHMQSSMPQMAHQSMAHQAVPQIPSSYAPQTPSSYVPQTYMYPAHQGMSYGYRPMMQQGRMMPSSMPMMAAGNTYGTPASSFPSQPPMYNQMAQQLVY